MRKIFISAGHSNTPGRDRGASGNGYIEGELAVELRDLIVKELTVLGNKPIIDGNNTILSDSLRFFKNLVNPNSIVLDIHWNAATPNATGVETLIPEVNSVFERNLGEALSSIISSTLNITKRGKNGVKTEIESHHGRLGWMRLNGENVLIEVCFITNKTDMQKYQDNKKVLAKNIAKVLFEYSLENSNTTYVVQRGDTLSKIAKNNNTTVEKLVSLNKLSSSNLITIGQVLNIK